MGGIADKDWESVCEARTRAEQRALARQVGGSCEETVRVIYDTEQFQNFAEAVLQAEPESVEIEGSTATVRYEGGTFTATREDGAWKLVEERSAGSPSPE